MYGGKTVGSTVGLQHSTVQPPATSALTNHATIARPSQVRITIHTSDVLDALVDAAGPYTTVSLCNTDAAAPHMVAMNA